MNGKRNGRLFAMILSPLLPHLLTFLFLSFPLRSVQSPFLVLHNVSSFSFSASCRCPFPSSLLLSSFLPHTLIFSSYLRSFHPPSLFFIYRVYPFCLPYSRQFSILVFFFCMSSLLYFPSISPVVIFLFFPCSFPFPFPPTTHTPFVPSLKTRTEQP